ncbi:SPI2 translocated effector [Providencia alcalifaciens]|uniref:SPI2 translocated effector n=2 Tax=Providencia alcalifaciens TaxID=126385 RepID=A0AAW9V6S7_9GAMM|nr:SPI2 translocated effector [Providencia alcalifaciens]MTC33352.1 SPI2 translocated effector [Providencia alcalifaciens]MTD00282.1 SPI2 translocated effector [Providencia alcalifaciens]
MNIGLSANLLYFKELVMAEINASQYFISPRNGVNPKSYIGVEYGLYKYHIDKDQINNHINNIHNTHLKLDGIHGLTVFGDSLSDTGNMYEKTHKIFPSTNQHYKGRFTNGFTWVDSLARPNGLFSRCVNKAMGGAVIGSYKLKDGFKSSVMSCLKKQISETEINSDDLVIVFAGANDYMTLHKYDTGKVETDQLTNLKTLIRKGAKNIVVVGTPDMSSTPAAARRSHQRQTELAVLTDTHNARTKLMIEKLNSRNKNSDIRIHYFDIGEKMKVIINEANQISDYNTKESFYKKWYIKLFKNKKMVINHKYIFNDKVHPSQEVQFILAYEMEKFIKSKFA